MFLLYSTASSAKEQVQKKQLHIVVTLPPLAGLAQWLTPQADVQCLLPSNADPHHFQLTPRQVESTTVSDILIRASRDDGQWKGLQHRQTLDVWSRSKHDQHAWLNVATLIEILHSMRSILAVNEQQWQRIENAIEQQQSAWKQALQPLKSRGVIMQHPAWRHVFEALDIPVLLVLESGHHGQEQGPRALEKALQVFTKHPDAVLIGDAHHSNRTLQWLFKHRPDTQYVSPIIKLDALGTCGESWISLMQHNLERITTNIAVKAP